MIKKKFYIASFTFLGLLLGFLVHSIVEIIYVRLLVRDFEYYSAGIPWSVILFLHVVWTLVTVIGGLWFGFAQGKYWWDQIYVKKQLGILFRRLKRKLK